MKMDSTKRAALAAALLAAAAGAAVAATPEERIAELERKVEALSQEAEKETLSDIYIEPGESAHGMGPAASKVYFKQHGLSFGGYGEMLYQNFEDGTKTDELDFLRWILYTGYKFNEKFVFNSEIEIEHAADDQEGEVAVEFAYVDYLARPELNLRAGMVLVPVGLVNELHEPTVFLSARRPDVESRIIPTTWRENGAGLFGEAGGFSYKAYVVNGFDASGFSSAGLRGGRQKGSKAKAENLAGVARLDYEGIDGLVVGASTYYGDSGQDIDADVTTLLYEGHVDWKWRGLELRGLAVAAELDDVAELNAILAEDAGTPIEDFDSVGEEMFGWYVQLGFDVLSVLAPGEASLTPFVRYEEYNTQESVPSGFSESGKNDVEIVTVGLNYKPITELVAKAEYQFYDNAAGSVEDQANVALGYIF
jgi:hypothetical protein